MKKFLATTAIAAFMSTGFFSSIAMACGDGSCEPPPPPPVEVIVNDDGGSDDLCPGGDEAGVLRKVGQLQVGDPVTRRSGDNLVSARGGDWQVLEILKESVPQRVCLQRVRNTASVKKTAPVAEKRQCNAPTGYVCSDAYGGNKRD